MTQPSIAPHILAVAAYLSIAWGIYLIYTIYDYLRAKTRRMDGERRGGETVSALRRMLVAVCVWSMPFSLVVRTIAVLAGFGNDQVGQVMFFALVGPNVVGSTFAVVTVADDLPKIRRRR